MHSAQVDLSNTPESGAPTIMNHPTPPMVVNPPTSTGAHGRRWLPNRTSTMADIPDTVHALPASTSFLRDILACLPSLLQTRTVRPDRLVEPRWTDETYDFLVDIDTDDIASAPKCGKGGYGTVYCVKHRSAGKVALKELHGDGSQESIDEQIRRILREGETWLSLDHPGVLRIYGVIESCNTLYLVTPYLQHGSLRDYLKGHPEADRLRLIQEIAAALAYLHALGLTHGDITAGNVLMSDDLHAVLCDFGLAKPITEATSVGLKGSGNPRWQSPELWLPDASKTEKSDVWAFAMTAYEVLSGKLPFHEYSPWSVIAAVGQRDERPLKGPTHSQSGQSYAAAWVVVSDCWHKLPNKRLTMEVAHRRLLEADPSRIELTTIDIENIRYSDKVGLGASADIYLVRHPTAGPLALKRMRLRGEADAHRRRTLREAGHWATLHHPNILQFLGILESAGQMYLLSPFLKNGTLPEYIRRSQDADCSRFLCEAAAGIMYLHDQNVVHGDIKGSNILVSDEIHAQICDFGLSKAVDEATSTGLKGIGNFRWMSPELFDAYGAKTFESDVWAFGMTVHEVLSGHVPFGAQRSNPAVILAIVNHNMPPMEPTESPSGDSYSVLWSLVADILQQDPKLRPTMRQAHDRLDSSQPEPSSQHANRRAPNPPSSVAAPMEYFVPGWYRAIYAFKGQGEEEMSLEVGQLYECEERGGNPGDGWVNAAHMVRRVVKSGLVPEAYLEFVRPI